MSACILTGFAKKKKYVGTIYACNGSDLPDTQDFGTVQYQGPSETALDVPATTVTYTIIGKTQCGDDIRRITTKTYSSRGGANLYRAYCNGLVSIVGTYFDERNTPDLRAIGEFVAYGSTLSIATLGRYALYQSHAAETLTGLDDLTWTKITSGPNYTGYYVTYFNGTLYRNVYSPYGVTNTFGSYYYLDVHEVWTYDLV